MKKISINIHQRSLWYLVIYGGIVLIFVLVLILPLSLSNANKITGNKKIKQQIAEQKELAPFHLTLLKSLQNKDVRVLPNPLKITISRGEAGKFQDALRTITASSGLILVSFVPDMSTLTGSSTSLLHNVVVKGEFTNFRKMLIGLGAVPYLDRIEEINIQQNSDSMELRMKIWIALK